MLLKNNNAIIYGAGDVYRWAHSPQQIQDINGVEDRIDRM
jgi:hypothetical protein